MLLKCYQQLLFSVMYSGYPGINVTFMVRNLNHFFQWLLTMIFNANQPEAQENGSQGA